MTYLLPCFAILAVLAVSCPQVLAERVMKQLHVFTRHGSRLPLAKDALTLEESAADKSILTPIGQEQHYQLGTWLRYRYSEVFRSVMMEYDASKVRIESSDLERTLTSASSLALGLYPSQFRGESLIPTTPANIPVYTRQVVHDLNIRSYDKCPAFHDELERLYQSPQWETLEKKNMDLLRNLAEIPAFSDYVNVHDISNQKYVPLYEIWNVFDMIHVAKTECQDSTALEPCTQLPDPSLVSVLSDDVWKEVEQLAHKAEFLRYSPSTAGTKLGGPMWDTILRRVQALGPDRLYVTSAHYPTLLGLFAALGLPWGDMDEEEVLPDYASALLLEVYQEGPNPANLYVKVYYKPGSAADVMAVRISDNCPTDTDQGCPFAIFAQVVDKARLTPEEWCVACGNTKADVCMKQQLERYQEQSCLNNSSGNLAGIYFAGVGTILVLVLLIALIMRYMRSTEAKRRENRESKEIELTKELAEVNSDHAPRTESPITRVEDEAHSSDSDEIMADGAIMA